VETDVEIDTDMEIDTDIDRGWTRIVATAPYGLPVTYHSASSNRAINLQRRMTCLFFKIHTAIGTSLQTMC
jgi:hypothetical protein